MAATIHRRRALQTIGALAAAQTLIVPARAKTETIRIFFNYGSAELVPSAMQLIEAVRSLAVKNSRVTIAGNCDTAEQNPDALGLARAVEILKVLAAGTIQPGVRLTAQSNAIADLMVKTGPNVREPQNRRAVITID